MSVQFKPIHLTDHVVVSREEYDGLVGLRERATMKLHQLRMLPNEQYDAAIVERIRVLEWLLGE